MKNNFYKGIFILFIFSFLLSFSKDASALQLVPACGEGTSISDRCTLCHLFIGMKEIIDWGRNILVIVAVVAIVAGGIMYIISAGDEKMMSSAKGIIKQALWGVLIVLGAWVIVNTTMVVLGTNLNALSITSSWNEFSCSTTVSTGENCNFTYTDWGPCTLDTSGVMVQVRSVLNYPANCSASPVIVRTCGSTSDCTSFNVVWSPIPCAPGDTQTSSAVGVPAGCTVDSAMFTPGTRECPNAASVLGSEQGVRDLLAGSGITINRPDACTNADHVGCTDVGGLRQSSIDGIVAFKNNCGASCDVMITGGSEGYGIHSESGTYSHINGYKVDIRPTSEVDSYITNNYTRIPQPRSDGAIGYRDSAGNTYYREGDHWDVTYF